MTTMRASRFSYSEPVSTNELIVEHDTLTLIRRQEGRPVASESCTVDGLKDLDKFTIQRLVRQMSSDIDDWLEKIDEVAGLLHIKVTLVHAGHGRKLVDDDPATD